MYQNRLKQVVKVKSTKENNKYQLLYIYIYIYIYIHGAPAYDGLWIRPKYVEVDRRNIVMIKVALGWFY